ncbi:hypothetical protein [Chitinophaga varians]|uniref:hypothetical protein n=1 Tax=Chitinophaga varians TaxID=2202339 RepID=UPI00165FA153|nr:hypothetical protein [Chitinophaga varians]MBC9910593.1 hypothetical protein [Chitinophaga varians]
MMLTQVKQGVGNIIEEGVEIPANVTLGNYNVIRKGVRFEVLAGAGQFHIGDCNVFNENVKVLIGPSGISVGDWNVFHNSILVTAIGDIPTTIGHNCWFGQNSILDGSGGLTIGHGVRIGMYSQVWSHVASGEQLEGCLLHSTGHTVIENDVWLVGSCIVASGVTIRERTICMTTSFIQKNTDAHSTYSGNPAKKQEKLKLWYKPTMAEKLGMMKKWSHEFVGLNPDIRLEEEDGILRLTNTLGEVVIIGCADTLPELSAGQSYFSLATKNYTKSLSQLERKFYKYIYNNKARFLPINTSNE